MRNTSFSFAQSWFLFWFEGFSKVNDSPARNSSPTHIKTLRSRASRLFLQERVRECEMMDVIIRSSVIVFVSDKSLLSVAMRIFNLFFNNSIVK